jgi:hypothetical protein
MNFWDIEEEVFDYDIEKKKLIDNMNYLHSMSVEEQTLYKKWQEWNSDLPTHMKRRDSIWRSYDMIWMPEDIMDKDKTIKEIEELEPYVHIVDSDKETQQWTDLRKCISSMEFTANPGRNIKAFVRDRKSNKVLGIISLGSDVTSLGVRDTYIGWDKDNKYKDGKLNHTAIGTSIIPTQPLGFNFLGGKLVSALTTSPTFRNLWKEKYGQTLIAVGTTSLYGVHSQYNGIPHFKTLGESTGKVSIKPDDKHYDVWHQWIKENKSEEYIKNTTQKEGIQGPVSGVKQRILSMIFKELGIKSTEYHHGFKRGVYFAQMYENGNEFLRNEIEDCDLKIKQKFEEGDDYTIRWWKKKAIRRYEKLHSEGRLKAETLFYLDILGMSWEDCKKKYLKEVGR